MACVLCVQEFFPKRSTNPGFSPMASSRRLPKPWMSVASHLSRNLNAFGSRDVEAFFCLQLQKLEAFAVSRRSATRPCTTATFYEARGARGAKIAGKQEPGILSLFDFGEETRHLCKVIVRHEGCQVFEAPMLLRGKVPPGHGKAPKNIPGQLQVQQYRLSLCILNVQSVQASIRSFCLL